MLQPRVSIATLIACVFGWQLRCLVLRASQFQRILNNPGQSSEAYLGRAGHQLSLLSGKRRGMILQELCKKELDRLHPHSTITEPSRGACCNGAQRSASQAEWDFSLGGRKVECKSAQMSWQENGKRWVVRFRGIKLPRPGFREQAPFDDLYLTIFSPDSLYIIKHDLQTGVIKVGKKTTSGGGHDIQIHGARRQECWQTALSQILDKLLAAGHCKLVAHIDLSAPEVRAFLAQQMEGMAARQDTEYEGVPLSQITPALRGLRIEEIAFEVNRMLHPNCSLSRTSSNVDWVRGEVRVEVKHGMMLFDKGQRRWECSFRNIQCASSGVRACDIFDELWLAIYSPFGIHILKHPGGQVRFILTGLTDQHSGQALHVYSSRNVFDVREALDEMLHKMEDWGCQPLATILW